MLILLERDLPYDLAPVLSLYDSCKIKFSIKNFTGLLVARRDDRGGKIRTEVQLEGAKYFFHTRDEKYDSKFDIYRVTKGNPVLVVQAFTSVPHYNRHLAPILILGRENFGVDKRGAYFSLDSKKIYNPKAISDLAGYKACKKFAGVYEMFNNDPVGQLMLFDWESKVTFVEDAQTAASLGELPAAPSKVKLLSNPNYEDDPLYKKMKNYFKDLKK